MTFDDVTDGRDITGATQTVLDFQAPSWIFLHELMHLIVGIHDPPWPGREVYDVAGMMQLNFADAIYNAESYAIVAGSWDITRHSTQNQQGWGVELFEGYTVQGFRT